MEDSLAFMMGNAHQDNEMMVFDWVNAAKLIKKINPEKASAGLAEDWENTGGVIYESGRIIFDDYTYLASTWARPELCIDGQ